jgi:hypothetical protein
MRHYTVKMMHGFGTFKCPLCKHSVTTREFSTQNVTAVPKRLGQ